MKILAASVVMLGALSAGLPPLARVHAQLARPAQSAPLKAPPATPVEVPGVQPTSEKPIVPYQKGVPTAFHTSERCVACHNGMKTAGGEDYDIGLDWRASIMANSSRDPYWQGSVRRETLDHPESAQAIQTECSFCHMPAVRLADRDAGRETEVFKRLPLSGFPKGDTAAADGVTCSVCHLIDKAGLGTDATFNGNVAISRATRDDQRPEYGPYDPDHAHQTMMHSSTGGYLPMHGDHIRDAALCASCHTLYTEVLGPGGIRLDVKFPEQVPYQEWQHSDFGSSPSSSAYQTCQQCHMPAVAGKTPITALFGEQREGARRHVFVGSNFIMEGMLNDHRADLATAATPEEMEAAMKRTSEFLKTQSARVTVGNLQTQGDKVGVDIHVENLGGHKLPTAYPSRRAWLHVTLRDSNGKVLFESGALKPDGSITGNDNDEDPTKFEPHWREINDPSQVEIFEPILGDTEGRVTTGLLNAARYLKDNRLLPRGFDKATARPDVQVVGDAAQDPNFAAGGATIRYVMPTSGASGPLHVEAELMFQPIGYRWAHNLAPYKASEPQRMVKYFVAASGKSATVLSRAAQ